MLIGFIKIFTLSFIINFLSGIMQENVRVINQDQADETVALPSYLQPEHKSVLEKWLIRKYDFRVATEADCTDTENLEIWRKDLGKSFNPYYSIGDFR